MSDIVVDSSVAAKWVVPEPDSSLAHRMAADAQTAGRSLLTGATMNRIGSAIGVLALVALGAQLSSQEKKGMPGVVVDKDAKTVTIDAKIAPRAIYKENDKDKIYPLEVIACWPHPKGKKAHETIVTIDEAIKPSEIHKALESLGLKAGKAVMGAGEPKGPVINVYFLVNDPTGLPRKVTLDKAMVDAKNGKPFPKKVDGKDITWLFTGSTMTAPDASKDQKIYGADFSGTFMAIFPVTSETIVQSSLTIEYEGIMKLEVSKTMPKVGTPVKLVLEVKK